MDTLVVDLVHLIDNHLNIIEVLLLKPTYTNGSRCLKKLSLESKLYKAFDENNHHWILYLLPRVGGKLINLKAFKKGYIDKATLKLRNNTKGISVFEKLQHLKRKAYLLGRKCLDFDLIDVNSKHMDSIYGPYLHGIALSGNIDFFNKSWDPVRHLPAMFLLKDENLILGMMSEYIKQLIIASDKNVYRNILGICNHQSYNNLLELLILLRVDSFEILISINRYDLIKKHWSFFDQIDSESLRAMMSPRPWTDKYKTTLYRCLVINRDDEIIKFIETRSSELLHKPDFWQPDGIITESNCWSHIEIMCRTKNFKKIPIKPNYTSKLLISSILFKYDSVGCVKNVIMMIDNLDTLNNVLHSIAVKRQSIDKSLTHATVRRQYDTIFIKPTREILIPGTFESIVWNFVQMDVDNLRLECKKLNIKIDDTIDKLKLIKKLTRAIL